MAQVELIATAAFGLESVVARELKDLGYADTHPFMGGVSFRGALRDIPRLNLWLRSSDRVLVKIGEFTAFTFDELFESTKALPWEEWLPEDAEFPVDGRSAVSQLFSVSDCQAIVKKAVVEKLKLRYGKDWFPETGGKYRIEVALLKDVATLTIDTTGPSLHKRGYRRIAGPAPMRETLAAAVLRLSRWTPDQPLVDPLCGAGTIAIEAALIGMNVAPGLSRGFASEAWPIIGAKVWQEARDEAKAAARRDVELQIDASDIDGGVLEIARRAAREAGVGNQIRFAHAAVRDLTSYLEYGHIICNPPYGERLGDKREAESIYRDMRKSFTAMSTWSYTVLTSFAGFEKVFGLYADKKRRVFNGQIECVLYQFNGPRRPRVEGAAQVQRTES